MPLGPQPRRARGTVERPYSALQLRLALAVFGLIVCAGAAVLMWNAGHAAFGWVLMVLAIIAVPDIIVISIRMRRSRR